MKKKKLNKIKHTVKEVEVSESYYVKRDLLKSFVLSLLAIFVIACIYWFEHLNLNIF